MSAATIERKRRAADATRAAADPWSELRELLRKKTPDDDPRLGELVDRLKIISREIPLLREVVAEADRLASSPSPEDLWAEFQAAGDAFDDTRKKRNTGIANLDQYEEARQKFEKIAGQHAQASYDHDWLRALRGFWPRLLGAEPIELSKEAALWLPAPVRNKMRELGLDPDALEPQR